MIVKRLIIFFITALMVSACSKVKGPDKPKNLISEEKMVAILIDAKIIATATSINKKIMQDAGVNLNAYVYTKHNVDSLQFALSNAYYAFHLKDYEAIYEKVTDSLEALKTKYKNLEAEEWKQKTKREEDSLKSILTTKELDSLGILEIEDALENLQIEDSLTETPLNKKTLIKPVSDN